MFWLALLGVTARGPLPPLGPEPLRERSPLVHAFVCGGRAAAAWFGCAWPDSRRWRGGCAALVALLGRSVWRRQLLLVISGCIAERV